MLVSLLCVRLCLRACASTHHADLYSQKQYSVHVAGKQVCKYVFTTSSHSKLQKHI